MNADAVLVLQRSDVARIVEQPERYASTRMLFVDPGLMDEAVVRGVKNYQLRRLVVGPDFQARACAEALARATLLDLRLTQERERLWPGSNLHGWDVGLFYLALLRALVVKQLGHLIEESFAERRIGLLRPSLAQQMYFDSFVCTDLVARDPDRWVVVDTYEQVRWHQPEAYSQVFDGTALQAVMAASGATAITHVPTCFYDRAWLADQVAKAHPRSVDLPSPLWDVPLLRQDALLQPLADQAGSSEASAYQQAAAAVIETELASLLPLQLPRARQVQAWSGRCRWQALNFLALRQGLADSKPQFLVSDQDTGLNGPLFSVAAGLGAPVTVVPHSGHPSMVLPHALRVTAVEQAGYGTPPRTVLGQTVALRPVRYAAPLPRLQPQRVRAVCLLLNSMQTEGLSYVDVFALAAFHKPLAALCMSHGVELIVRAKPGAPALSVLAAALGLAPQELVTSLQRSLDDLAAATQVCIAYGEPTTGVAAFLQTGSLVLQVNEQLWPSDYVACMPLVRDGVIPLLDNQTALQHLSVWLSDPAHFQRACGAQSAAVDQRASLAHERLFDSPTAAN